jgi:hypothetical protein
VSWRVSHGKKWRGGCTKQEHEKASHCGSAVLCSASLMHERERHGTA